MDSLETPYDDEDEFIYCAVCDKSLRGDTLYKIHLTIPAHLKLCLRRQNLFVPWKKITPEQKEDAFVAQGKAVRQHIVPEFEDIEQYLKYLNLDEPIIGPRYICRLCTVSAHLPDMVHHVIGRKHRLKYLEAKRPDLVTWDKQTLSTKGGKIIRAKTEVVERQDGRGTPQRMRKNRIVGESNISQVGPQQRQSRDSLRDVSPVLPEHKNFNNGQRRVLLPTPGGHRDDHYMLTPDREDHHPMEQDLRRVGHREGNMYRQQFMEPEYRSRYEEQYVEDLQRREMLAGVSRYNSREENQHGQAHSQGPRRPFPEKDLKEFYTEEVRCRQASSQHPQGMYSEFDAHPQPRDREPGRYDRSGRVSSSDREASMQRFSTFSDSENPHNHLVDVIRNYRKKRMDEEAASARAGPSRPSPSRPANLDRTISDIPEPFLRFLKGGDKSVGQEKRKRESRFSDATTEEIFSAKKRFIDDLHLPNPKFGGHSASVNLPLMPETHGRQHPVNYTDSQSPPHAERYNREFTTDRPTDSGSVLDILKNIEIDNAEDASFLQNKLCNVLKEFKAKKSEKTMHNNQERAVISEDYNSLRSAPQQFAQDHYKRTPRGDTDHRQAEDPYNRDHRRRDRRHPEEVFGERMCGELEHSSRGPYMESYGWSEMSPDWPAQFPERYQKPFPPRDYQPSEGFLEPCSSGPSQHMDRGPRMSPGRHTSRNLDKITSTLLELVARK